jgi:hypothetical protein
MARPSERLEAYLENLKAVFQARPKASAYRCFEILTHLKPSNPATQMTYCQQQNYIVS